MGASLVGYNGLDRLFWTSAFQGNMSWIGKLGWIGGYLSDFISIFCILGLFMLGFQIVFTLVYFSAPEFWKNVHKIKTEQVAAGGGRKVLGYSADTIKTWNNGDLGSSKSVGLDVFVDLIYVFVPNMMRYSDYNPDYRDEKLQDDDTLGRWLVVSFPRKIFLMFILAFAFSGGLWQAYGQVIAVSTVLANEVVSQNFVQAAQNEINTLGGGFHTTLGKDGSAMGKSKEALFDKCYSSLIVNGNVSGGQAKQEIGIKLQNMINNLSATQIGSYIHQATGQKLTQDEINNFKCSVYTNTSPDAMGGWPIPFSDFMTNTNSNGLQQYIHVYFSASTPTNLFNYKIKTNATPNGTNTPL